MTFDPFTRATWSELLTLPQVAAIWQKTPAAISRQVQRRSITPAPVLKPRTAKYEKPYRWRKAEVVLHLDGYAGSVRRAS